MFNLDMIHNIANYLKKNNLTIATAESCTGGLLAHSLTNISGSSEYFDRGVVTYSNKAKMDLLKVSPTILQKYGAVSLQTAKAMAIGVRDSANVDIGISITGIAGPTGGTKEKPVGLVFIGIATYNSSEVQHFIFSKDRLQNKEETCKKALEILLDTLQNW
jgi:PncC family amidohydrolase